MSNDKAYKREYYKKNKAKIKERSRLAYKEQKELKAQNIGNIGKPISNSGNTFFSIDSPNTSSIASPENIMGYLNSWIYSCCQINASAVASQNLRLYATVDNSMNNKFLHKYREVSKDELGYIKDKSSVKSLARVRSAENVVEIIDHPVLDLLDNFNPFNNSFESFELTSTYLDMIGDAYWWVRKDSFGMPYEVWVLQGQYMRIVPAKGMDTFIKGYLYGKSNMGAFVGDKDLIKFKRDEIIHFKTPNPSSLYYGKGAAQAVIGAINRMDAMDTSESARLRNMGRPDFVVNYKGKVDISEIKKIERMWMNSFGGPNKDGKIKVMDEDFDIKELGFSPRDMEYLSGRVWTLKEISAAFNVPYSMLDSSDAKKATSEIAERVYAKLGVLPRISRIAEKLTEQLIPMYDNSNRMFFMYDNCIPSDKKLMIEENVAYVKTGIITVNEARMKLGMKTLDGEKYDTPSLMASNSGGSVPVNDETPTNDGDE